jgi:hypothetical protein
MRPRHILTSVAVGLAARAIIRRRRARRAAPLDPFASDPDDPVQNLDEVPELQASPLDVDAVSQEDAEAAQDLAGLEVGIDETAASDAETAALVEEAPPAAHVRDAGDLYGAHTPPAVDRDHPDDDRAFDEGQNWIEALETSAIENGAEPERELDDIVDDEDVQSPPHASDTRDTPVADHGAGGRSGL